MPNLILIKPETAFTWDNAGTGAANLMDLGGLAADAVAMGSWQDLGSGSRPSFYNIELLIDGFDSPPVLDELVKLYFAYSNAETNFDGNPTTDPTASAEGTMSVAQLVNVDFIDSAAVYSVTAANELKITVKNVEITSRYLSPVVHNATADAFLSTADAHLLTVTPIPPEVQ